jgi:hypothetical protein
MTRLILPVVVSNLLKNESIMLTRYQSARRLSGAAVRVESGNHSILLKKYLAIWSKCNLEILLQNTATYLWIYYIILHIYSYLLLWVGSSCFKY